jgi:hypothetical protein
MSRAALQQQVDELRGQLEELQRWRAAQDQVWTDWSDGRAVAQQGRAAPAPRPHRPRSAAPLSLVPSGGAA